MGSSVRVGGGRVDRVVVKVSRVGVGPVSGCCVCSVQIEGCWACPAPRVGSPQTSTAVRVGGVAFLEPVGLEKGARSQYSQEGVKAAGSVPRVQVAHSYDQTTKAWGGRAAGGRGGLQDVFRDLPTWEPEAVPWAEGCPLVTQLRSWAGSLRFLPSYWPIVHSLLRQVGAWGCPGLAISCLRLSGSKQASQ